MMIWEMLIDRNLTADEIATTISDLLLIPLADILVVDDITSVNIDLKTKVVCENTAIGGDFSMMLSIYLRDPNLGKLDIKASTGQFSSMLRCKCLISDESANPYSWLLIQGTTDCQIVYLDPDKLDENEEYLVKTIEVPQAITN
ncbi:MAG: hypothetical protein F6K47_13730 [Symploca sp. SIO2E6]|nr:hypothetical protein [Symploca sp. SIO2E6]